MIIEREKVIKNVMGGQGQSQQMTIDSASLAHIMQVLTNLYSDPELAVIREYTTNASDSHVAAGKKSTPITVTLPTAFEPHFIVKDSGVGLNAEQVFNVFGAYGASTKRDTNEQVGALGLGCKSALTYTKQFSLTAIHDGMKRVYSVHLDEFGVGKITELAVTATNEPNGVEINIPVKNINSFLEKARRFYRFYGYPVDFVNASERFLADTSLKDTERISLTDEVDFIKGVSSHNHAEDVVVMGGVAYTIDPYQFERYSNVFHKGTLVIKAPIGAVNFTPNRESLHYTETTKRYINAKVKEAEKAFVAKVIEAARAAPNVLEAYRILTENRTNIVRCGGINSTVDYQDYNLVDNKGTFNDFNVPRPGVDIIARHISLYGNTTYKLMEGSYVGLLSRLLTDKNEFVTIRLGRADILNTYSRGIIRTYMENFRENDDYILVLKHDFEFPKAFKAILPERELGYENIKAMVLSLRKQSREGRGSAVQKIPQYPELFNRHMDMKLDATKPIIYSYESNVDGSQNKRLHKSELESLGLIDGEHQYVFIAANRKDKFHKLFPQAINLETFFQRQIVKVADKLTEEEIELIAFGRMRNEIGGYKVSRVVSRLSPWGADKKQGIIDSLNDEDIRAILSLEEKSLPRLAAILTNNYALISPSHSNVKLITKKTQEWVERFNRIERDYPLFFQQEDFNFWVNYVNGRKGE